MTENDEEAKARITGESAAVANQLIEALTAAGLLGLVAFGIWFIVTSSSVVVP